MTRVSITTIIIAVTIPITMCHTPPSPLRLTNTLKMLQTLITHSHTHNHVIICPKWIANADFGHRKGVTTCLSCTHMSIGTTRRRVTTVRVLTNWARKSRNLLLAFNSMLKRCHTCFHTTTHDTLFNHVSRQHPDQLFHAQNHLVTSHINQSVFSTCRPLLTSIVLSTRHRYLYLFGNVHIIHLQALKHVVGSSDSTTSTTKNNRLVLPIDQRVQLPQERHTQDAWTLYWQNSKSQQRTDTFTKYYQHMNVLVSSNHTLISHVNLHFLTLMRLNTELL